MEQYASIQQLKKKEPGAEERKNIYPPTPVQAVFDAKTGANLEALLAQYNSIYVQYQGTPYDTRCIIPDIMRRQGLIISYVDMQGVTIEEQCINATRRDNEHWGKDENWLNLSELHDKVIQTAYVSLERIIEAANAFMDKLNQGVSPDMLSESVKQLLAEAGATVTNLPDEEDITTTGGTIPTLKFKDKEYLPEMSSGLGRKILRKNMVTGNRHTATVRVTAPVALDGTITVILNGSPHTVPVTAEAHSTIELVAQAIASVANDHYNVSAQDEYVTFVSKTIGEASATTIDNGSTGTSFIINDTAVEDTINLLSQDMVQKANTIYIVQYDFDLNGETLTIPEGCVLEFQGGSFSNGTLVGNNTNIISNPSFTNITFLGVFKNSEIYVDWFGAKGDGITDDSKAIQDALDFAKLCNATTVLFNKSIYYIDFPIFILGKNITIDGRNVVTIIATQNGRARGGLNIGQSYEFNKDATDLARINGSYSSINLDYDNNPLLGEDVSTIFYHNSNRNEAENCWIKNITVKFDYSRPNSWGWGGYAFNISNSYNCHIRNCISYHACQMLSLGSDTGKETPGNCYCSAEDCIAYEPINNTYYSIGFLCNGYKCWFKNCICLDIIPAESDGSLQENGNGAALAFSKYCYFSDIKISTGKNVVNGEAITLNNCHSCSLTNIEVFESKIGISVYHQEESISYGNNFISDCLIRNCNIGISITSKQNQFENIYFKNCTTDISFTNINAQFNSFRNVDANTIANSFESNYQLMDNGNIIHTIYDKKQLYIYLGAYEKNSRKNDIYQALGDITTYSIRIPLHIHNIIRVTTQVMFPERSTVDSSITFTLYHSSKVTNDTNNLGIKKVAYTVVPYSALIGTTQDVDVNIYNQDIEGPVGNIDYQWWLDITISNCPDYTTIKGLLFEYFSVK